MTRGRRDRRALVRVTHASVGVTDVAAARGDYLLQPVKGFVPGYDFVGIIEQLPAGGSPGLSVGERVAGVLPRMGVHANLINAAPSLLVPVPDLLDSAAAATMPLDALTAVFALDSLPAKSGSILVQGAGGAVGAWAAQLATARGFTVYGTASPRPRAYAAQFTESLFDYGDPGWIEQLLDLTAGGVDGAIDHTGSRSVRRAVRADGRIVRTAFGGSPGHRRIRMATGFAASIGHRYARPDVRICSVPTIVATQRVRYRQALTDLFAAVSNRKLIPPQPRIASLADYLDALAAAAGAEPGEKVVLALAGE